MFDRLIDKANHHDSVHQREGLDNVTLYHKDKSCPSCYPPEEDTSENFDNFWNWFTEQFPAQDYNWYTQQAFLELFHAQGDETWEALGDLLLSIRYYYHPEVDFETLQQEIWNLFVYTEGFFIDPQLVDFSETTSTPEENNPSDSSDELAYSTPEGADYSDEEEQPEYAPLPELPNIPIFVQLQQLQQQNQPPLQQPQPPPVQPIPMAQPQQVDLANLTAALTALQNALPNTNQALVNNTNAVNNPPRREGRVADLPHFNGGDQDPITWLRNFTNACNANGINNNRKLEVVPAYLKGAAATWWDTNQALANGHANRIATWTGVANNNTEFTHHFPAAFRTQTMIEIWNTELEQRKQRIGEDVNTYAADLQELYSRVELANGFNYPELVKARKFVNGLTPDLYVTVKPHNDQTWNAAVERAKSYELTHSNAGAVSAYLNKFTPIHVTNQNDVLCKAILELTKQIQNFSSNNSNNNRRYNNRNIPPNANQSNQGGNPS